MTIREAISDVQLRLGINSDDGKIPRRQIRHWINTNRSEVIIDDYKETGELDSSLLTEYKCQALLKEKFDCECGYRWYYNLPGSIIDLPDDIGVQVYRRGGKSIDNHSTVGQNSLLNAAGFTDDKSRYRVGQKLIFNGVYAENFQVDLYLLLADISSLNEDEQLPLSPGLDEKLIKKVYEIGLRELQIPFDYANDGADEKEKIR